MKSGFEIVQEIFGRAIELKGTKRQDYLNRACPDETVRREVGSLLAEHDKNENFLDLYTSIAGKVLAHYEILGRLGHGAMGIVYQARDRRLGRLVAIKVPDPLSLTDARYQKRLLNEARCASAINHPNVVTIHEFGSSKGVAYVVMEYVAGQTLARSIPSGGWHVGKALRYGDQIAAALAASHKTGVVHGDLKPDNIMVAEIGQVKLLDFGLARFIDGPAGRSPAKPPRARFGTRAYMAPELLEDPARAPDPRSEVFTFGLILHQMLTGQHAFGPGTPEKLAEAIRTREPGSLPENTPPPLVEIIEYCLRKNPDERGRPINELWAGVILAGGANEINGATGPQAGPTPPTSPGKIQSILKRIGYRDLAKSRSALSELKSFIAAHDTAAVRQSALSGLRDVILAMPDFGGNGIPRAVRELRKTVLLALKETAENHLSGCLRETDLEELDLYGMDFASADLSGLSFKGSFLVEADFRATSLPQASLAQASLRNVHFEGAQLTNTDFTDTDWFNADGLTEKQLATARRETLMQCPKDTGQMHRYLSTHYGFPFESWSLAIQEQLITTWSEYLRPGGLRDIVASWRQTSRVGV
jgi:serine/threonine protein kinase